MKAFILISMAVFMSLSFIPCSMAEEAPKATPKVVSETKATPVSSPSGSSSGLYEQAVIFQKQGNIRSAYDTYIKAIAEGDARAMLALGKLYDKGRGLLQNYEEAMKYYILASEKGSAEAEFNIGSMYFTGDGVEKDLKQAFSWFEKSANHGYANGAFNIGAMYYNGLGVPQSESEAEKWFKKAKKLGNPLADVVSELFGHDINLISRRLGGI